MHQEKETIEGKNETNRETEAMYERWKRDRNNVSEMATIFRVICKPLEIRIMNICRRESETYANVFVFLRRSSSTSMGM